MTSRPDAVLIREARADRYDPTTLRNATAMVHGGAWGFTLLGILALACAGDGLQFPAAIYGGLSLVGGVLFIAGVDNRARQQKLHVHMLRATLVGRWAVAQALRPEALAAEARTAFAKHDYAELITTLAEVA